MSEISDQDQDFSGDVDLFGQPVQPIRERRGRPCFRKDAENQLLVSTLVAAGWTQARIARYLGCDEKTLRKHFSRELEDGCDQIEAMALQVMVQKMRNGHSPSVKQVLEVIDEKGRPAPPTAPKSADTPKPDKLGKKAQAMEDAQNAHAGTGWGGLLPN